MHPVVAWLGLISYGVFPWHYVVTIELGFPGEGWAFAPLLVAALAVSIACGAASYYLVERPIPRFKYRSLREGLRTLFPARMRQTSG